MATTRQYADRLLVCRTQFISEDETPTKLKTSPQQVFLNLSMGDHVQIISGFGENGWVYGRLLGNSANKRGAKPLEGYFPESRVITPSVYHGVKEPTSVSQLSIDAMSSTSSVIHKRDATNDAVRRLESSIGLHTDDHTPHFPILDWRPVIRSVATPEKVVRMKRFPMNDFDVSTCHLSKLEPTGSTQVDHNYDRIVTRETEEHKKRMGLDMLLTQPRMAESGVSTPAVRLIDPSMRFPSHLASGTSDVSSSTETRSFLASLKYAVVGGGAYGFRPIGTLSDLMDGSEILELTAEGCRHPGKGGAIHLMDIDSLTRDFETRPSSAHNFFDSHMQTSHIRSDESSEAGTILDPTCSGDPSRLPKADFPYSLSPVAENISDRYSGFTSCFIGAASSRILRSTTTRIALGIRPSQLKIALERGKIGTRDYKLISNDSDHVDDLPSTFDIPQIAPSVINRYVASHKFRPMYHDQVNESVILSSDPCILSNAYIDNDKDRLRFRNMFQEKQGGKGRYLFERDSSVVSVDMLPRHKGRYIYYMEMDYIDVLMSHPYNWKFPDTSIVYEVGTDSPPDAWMTSKESDLCREFADSNFLLCNSVYTFPKKFLEDIAIGILPDWLKTYAEVDPDIKDFDFLVNRVEEATRVPSFTEGFSPSVESRNENLGISISRVQIDRLSFEFTKRDLMEAGLLDETEVYLKFDEAGIVSHKGRAIGCDVLEKRIQSFTLRSISGLRVVLDTFCFALGGGFTGKQLDLSEVNTAPSRGASPVSNPRRIITPNMVRNMAAQLGITGNYHFYWYALFALDFPLPDRYSCVIEDDIRYYVRMDSFECSSQSQNQSFRTETQTGKSPNVLSTCPLTEKGPLIYDYHLPSDTAMKQIIHPLIDVFRGHLTGIIQSDFLWCFRGGLRVKCGECALPDSSLWCAQCRDNFCANCFLRVHNKRQSHRPWPLPGSRYLQEVECRDFSYYGSPKISEIGPDLNKISGHMLFNIGYCQRRRFLATSNQSDITGNCLCRWLFFDVECFEQTVLSTDSSHIFLRRNNPPRLLDQRGFFYDMENRIITDDPASIRRETHVQNASIAIQKVARMHLAIVTLARTTAACTLIQSVVRMLISNARLTKSSGVHSTLRRWMARFNAKNRSMFIRHSSLKLQTRFRGIQDRRKSGILHKAATFVQSQWRRVLSNRFLSIKTVATETIQTRYRGWKSRQTLDKKHCYCSRIQSRWIGITTRRDYRILVHMASMVQMVFRGFASRMKLQAKREAVVVISSFWRGRMSRKRCQFLVLNDIEKQSTHREVIIMTLMINQAALCIQSEIRAFITRQRFSLQRIEKERAKSTVEMLAALVLIALGGIRHCVHPLIDLLPQLLRLKLHDLTTQLRFLVSNAWIGPDDKLIDEYSMGSKRKWEHLLRAKAHCIGRMTSVEDRRLDTDHLFLIFDSVISNLFGNDDDSMKTQTQIACQELAHLAVHANNKVMCLIPDRLASGCRKASPGDEFLGLPGYSIWSLIAAVVPADVLQVSVFAEILIVLRYHLMEPRLLMDSDLQLQPVNKEIVLTLLSEHLEQPLGVDDQSLEMTPEAVGRFVINNLRLGDYLSGRCISKLETSFDKSTPGEKLEKDHSAANRLITISPTLLFRSVQYIGSLFASRDPTKSSSSTKAPRIHEIRLINEFFAFSRSGLFSGTDGEHLAGQKEKKSASISGTSYFSCSTGAVESPIGWTEPQDHTAFLLAIIIVHQLLRGLLMRVIRHRAACKLQRRYRIFRKNRLIQRYSNEVLRLQAVWRGTLVRMRFPQIYISSVKIQRCFRSNRTKIRNARLLTDVLAIQSCYRGIAARNHILKVHESALMIQRIFRGHLERLYLHPDVVQQRTSHEIEVSRLVTMSSHCSIEVDSLIISGRLNLIDIAASELRCELKVRRIINEAVQDKKSKARAKTDKLRQIRLHGERSGFQSSKDLPSAKNRWSVKRMSCLECYSGAVSRISSKVKPTRTDPFLKSLMEIAWKSLISSEDRLILSIGNRSHFYRVRCRNVPLSIQRGLETILRFKKRSSASFGRYTHLSKEAHFLGDYGFGGTDGRLPREVHTRWTNKSLIIRSIGRDDLLFGSRVYNRCLRMAPLIINGFMMGICRHDAESASEPFKNCSLLDDIRAASEYLTKTVCGPNSAHAKTTVFARASDAVASILITLLLSHGKDPTTLYFTPTSSKHKKTSSRGTFPVGNQNSIPYIAGALSCLGVLKEFLISVTHHLSYEMCEQFTFRSPCAGKYRGPLSTPEMGTLISVYQRAASDTSLSVTGPLSRHSPVRVVRIIDFTADFITHVLLRQSFEKAIDKLLSISIEEQVSSSLNLGDIRNFDRILTKFNLLFHDRLGELCSAVALSLIEGVREMITVLSKEYVDDLNIQSTEKLMPSPKCCTGVTRNVFVIGDSYSGPSAEFLLYTKQLPWVTVQKLVKFQAVYRGYSTRRYKSRIFKFRKYYNSIGISGFDPVDELSDAIDSTSDYVSDQKVQVDELHSNVPDTDVIDSGEQATRHNKTRILNSMVETFVNEQRKSGICSADHPGVACVNSVSNSVGNIQSFNASDVNADHIACCNTIVIYTYLQYEWNKIHHAYEILREILGESLALALVVVSQYPSLQSMMGDISTQINSKVPELTWRRHAGRIEHGDSNQLSPHKAVSIPMTTESQRTSRRNAEEVSRKSITEAPLKQKVTMVGRIKGLFGRGAKTESRDRYNSKSPKTNPVSQKTESSKQCDEFRVKKLHSRSFESTPNSQKGKWSEPGATVEYMRQYLIIMAGDDSQFKDADPYASLSVINSDIMDVSQTKFDPDKYFSELRRSDVDIIEDGYSKQWLVSKLKPIWIGTKSIKYNSNKLQLLKLLKKSNLVSSRDTRSKTSERLDHRADIADSFVEQENGKNFRACCSLLENSTIGNLNILGSRSIASNQPFLVELVINTVFGFVSAAVRESQYDTASDLLRGILDNSENFLVDFHPQHRKVAEASVFDLCIGVVYALVNGRKSTDSTEPVSDDFKYLVDNLGAFFTQASNHYKDLRHPNRLLRLCIRYSCVLIAHGNYQEADLICSREFSPNVSESTPLRGTDLSARHSDVSSARSIKGRISITDRDPCVLQAILYINRAVAAISQGLLIEGDNHLRRGMKLLHRIPEIRGSVVQIIDNNSWLLRKLKEMSLREP